MNMATQEQAEAAVEPELVDEAPDQGDDAAPLVGYHEDEDDELPPGWLVISDGEQIVIPHPEGKTKEDVVADFFKAKKSKHHAFQLGLYVFDPEEITTFGWSEDIHFPEMEKFDGVQERIEGLMGAIGELTQSQAILQQAQAQLFQEELEERLQEEAEEDEGVPGPPLGITPPAAQAPAPTPIPVIKTGKKGFRPPGA